MIAAHLGHLVLPLVPERRVAVQEQHQRPLTHARVVEALAVHLGVVVLEYRAGGLRLRRDEQADGQQRSQDRGGHAHQSSSGW